MIAATNDAGTVDSERVVHLAVSRAFHQGGCSRASRLVVMPEWAGAGAEEHFGTTPLARMRLGVTYLQEQAAKRERRRLNQMERPCSLGL